MDKTKILRLLDEADDIVAALYRQALYRQDANKESKCKHLREKLRAIEAEISSAEEADSDAGN